MCKQSLCPKFFAIIQCLLFTLFAASQVAALSTDKDQPITIEADSAEMDDAQGTSIYHGNVVVVQGSIRMTGDKMTVYLTEDDELDTLIMEGKPAHYQQLPDGKKVYDKAQAMRMEFYELKELVVLLNQAVFIQEDTRFSGNRIDYDILNSKLKLRQATKQSSVTKNKRVQVILKPKKDKQK